jgi:hypothetical protein
MALQVIGVGFGRTGTLSLKAALERLGFGPCEHMVNCFDHPERFALWSEAAERKAKGGPIDWATLFAGYKATVDWPGAYFWRELVNAHSQAKVILSVRDPDRWYDSVAATIFRMPKLAGGGLAARGLLAVAGVVNPAARGAFRLNEAIIWDGTFGGRFEDRDHAIGVFNAHVAAVERTVAPGRLLVFDVTQGWEPLCAFLGVPVPDEPFPHLNDAAEFDRRIRQRLAPAVAAVVAGAALAAGGLVAAARTAARTGRDRRTTPRRGPGPSRGGRRTTSGSVPTADPNR